MPGFIARISLRSVNDDTENNDPSDAATRMGESYKARKLLFAKGLREGRLTVQEIETALPPGVLTAAERWLLYYSLRAAEVEILDENTGEVDHGFAFNTEMNPSNR